MQKKYNSGRLVRSPQRFHWKALGCFLAAAGLLTVSTVNAGQREWNLNDSNQTNDFLLRGNGAAWLQETGGNGYIQITPAVTSQTGTILFGDFDAGLVVKAFTFECDVKMGDGTNPPADGFSINYARSNDPTIANIEGGGSGIWAGEWAVAPDNHSANLPEEGTQTGVAIGFDTWGLPGSANGANDLRGISVRVDGRAIAQFAIPNVVPPAGSDGTDPTYLETGPWSDADKRGTGQYLTWQPLKVDLDELGILNVWYKNTQVLTNFDTGFFPSPGRLVFTGRTGGSQAMQAIDNLKITTIPSTTFLITGLSGKADGFTITVNDAQGSVLNPTSIQLKLNGADLASSTFTVQKSGNISTITYSHLPNFFPAGSTNLVSITASDNNGVEASLERPFVVRPYVQLDPSWIAPNGTYDTGNPGFVGYINQIAVGRGPGDSNNKWNPLRQLAGGYIDPATGNPYPNLADPASGAVNADGTFEVGGDSIFFDPFINMNGDVFNQGYDPFVNDVGAFRTANGFPDYELPGIPGTTLNTDNIVMEAYTYVQLAAPKLYTFVVNSDDGFWVTFGPQHRSALSTSQNSSAAFVGKGSSDVEFDIAVPAGGAGVYRARLVYWEGGGGNNVEFFTRKDGGGNALVGDTANGGLAAYKPAGAGQALEPELVSAAPWPGQTGVRPDSQIQVILADGTGKNVDGNSVVVKVNGATLNKTVAPKARGMTRITAVPTGLFDGGVNNVEVTWTAGGQTYTDTWSFTTLAYQALPEWLARPLGSATDPGFAARVHQLGTLQAEADAGRAIPNRWHARDQQMENLFGPSVATVPANQVQVLSTINFNGDEPLANVGFFTGDVKIPGIPGAKASRNTDDIAMEVVTYIEFANAGFYYMGVNSDDGFNVIAREKLNRLPGLKILSPSTLFASQNNYVGAIARAGQNATTPAALPVPAVEAKIVAAVPAIADTDLQNAAEIAGNIALIDRGTVTFADKIARARAAGAVAVIMVDNAPDRLPIEMGATENSVLPAVMITQADGATIKTALAAGEVRGSIGADTIPSLGFFNDGRGWDSGTMFGFGISKPGVYPFRLIWFEGGGGANCEWFFESASGTRVLINDPANAAVGLKAFRTAPPVTEPTEAEFNPPTISDGQVTLSWTGTGMLQESGNLVDWSNSANQANPQTITPDGANPAKFYRIQVSP